MTIFRIVKIRYTDNTTKYTIQVTVGKNEDIIRIPAKTAKTFIEKGMWTIQTLEKGGMKIEIYDIVND